MTGVRWRLRYTWARAATVGLSACLSLIAPAVGASAKPALYQLSEMKRAAGDELDVAFYRVYHYRLRASRRGQPQGVAAVPVADHGRKQAALEELGKWAPEEGRFAIALHSVADLFQAADRDPWEYVDVFDEVPSWRYRSAGDFYLDLFARGIALEYRFASKLGFRLSTQSGAGAPRPDGTPARGSVSFGWTLQM